MHEVDNSLREGTPQNTGQESGESNLAPEIRRETRLWKDKWTRSCATKRIEHRTHEEFETNHGGNGIAGKAEDGNAPPAEQGFRKDDGLAWLNVGAREMKPRVEFFEFGLHEIILSGGDASSDEQQVVAQALSA